MKKITLKALLMAAALGMGGNVWAEVTSVTQNYESDGVEPDWVSGNTDRYTVSVKTSDSNHYIGVDAVGNGNNGTAITCNTVKDKAAAGDDFASSDDFTMIFDLQLTGGNGQVSSWYINDASDNVGSYNAYTSPIFALKATAANSTNWIINDNEKQTISLSKSTWYTFKLTKSGSLLYLTVVNTADNTVIFERNTIDVKSSKGGLGRILFDTKRYYSSMAFDNLVLRKVQSDDVPSSTVYTLTTQYQLSDGTVVRDNNISYVEENESFTTPYDNTFDDDNYRYTYVSGSVTVNSVNADATYTIIYSREALAVHQVSFKTIGAINRTLETVEVKDAKSYTYIYPRYLVDGADLYQIVKTRYDQGFQNTVSNVTADVERTETFNKIDCVVAFFSEAEDIATLTTSSTNNNIPARCSGGNAAYASEDAVITTLVPGKYTITAAVFGNAGTDFVFKNGETELFRIATAGYQLELTSEEITLTEETTITLEKVGNGGSSPKVIDYVLIKRTGDYTVSKSISAAGYATLYSDKALDFTGTGLTAYVATVDGDDVSFTEVTKVPANTGVLLKGAEGTYAIPVTADGGTATSAMNGVTEDTQIPAGIFVLLVGDQGVGFYQTESTFTVGANTAYIPASVEGTEGSGQDAKRRFIAIENDDATAITAIEAADAIQNGVIYNLSGQRVVKPLKGIYIQNGKKILVK